MKTKICLMCGQKYKQPGKAKVCSPTCAIAYNKMLDNIGDKKMLQKQKPWRSERYKKYIRSLPCCVTGRVENIVAHHITTSASRGISTKTDDFFCIPLDAAVHQELHNNPEKFEKIYGLQLKHWQYTIAEAIRSGGLDGFSRWADDL